MNLPVPLDNLMYCGLSLAEALDGLQAHDGGATDSGISDQGIRDWARRVMLRATEADRRRFLARYARDRILSASAIAMGYGIADVAGLHEWIEGFLAEEV